jgi:hypothetical protein
MVSLQSGSPDVLQVLKLIDRGFPESLASVSVQLASESISLFAAFDEANLDGLLYVMTESAGLLGCFDSEQTALLRSAYQRQLERNHAYLELLTSFRDRLQDNGIDMLLLKGLYIGERFGGGYQRRFMWDMDVMVLPQNLAQAIQLAADLVLAPTAGSPPRWLLDLVNLHAVEVSHRGRAIDIHWCFRNRPGYHVDYQRVWRNASQMAIGGAEFTVLSDEDALLLATLEMASDVERSRVKLRSLWDSYLMLAALDGSLDWSAFFAKREQEGLHCLAGNMLSFALHALQCHDQFPQLAAQLRQRGMDRLIGSEEAARQILERPEKDLANRVLYSRLQPRPAPLYWLRRAATSPLRNSLLRKDV